MQFTEHDIAAELAAQLPDIDLGVTEAGVEKDAQFPVVYFRLDNGQTFQIQVTAL